MYIKYEVLMECLIIAAAKLLKSLTRPTLARLHIAYIELSFDLACMMLWIYWT